jgi:hypothetical protein
VLRADNLTTFMCRLCRNSGASVFWNPKDLSRPVAGKLCFFYVLIREVLGTGRMKSILLFVFERLNAKIAKYKLNAAVATGVQTEDSESLLGGVRRTGCALRRTARAI